jgi:hypothetical protein
VSLQAIVTWSWTILYGAALLVTLTNLADAITAHHSVAALNGSTRRMVTIAGVRGEFLRVLTFAAFFGIGVLALLDLFVDALGIVLVAASVPVLINSIADRRYRTRLLERVR